MENNQDWIYNAVKEESSEEVANKIFDYILGQYGFNPKETLTEVPELFEQLSVILEKDEYGMEEIYRMIDDSFIDYYHNTKKGLLVSF